MATSGGKRGRSGGQQQQPPPPAKRHKTRTSPRVSLSWSALNPELIGRIARYLNVGHDLTNLCIVIGPNISAVVRRAYLCNNDGYLIHYWNRVIMRSDAAADAWFRQKVRDWMKVNVNWTKRCLGAKSADNLQTVTLTAESARALTFRKYGDLVLYKGGSELRPSMKFPARLGMLRDDALVSVGGVDVTPCMSLDSIHALFSSKDIVQKGKIVIRYMKRVNFLFCHAVMAIEFGLTPVLKHMLEAGLVRINDTYIGDPNDDVSSSSAVRHTLLWHSLINAPVLSCFKYLLTVDGVNVNATFQDHPRNMPIHYCAGDEDVPLDVLETLLNHPNIDLNARDGDEGTAIFYACCAPNTPHEVKLAKLRVLLEAGVDPLLPDNEGNTPEDFLLKYLLANETNKAKKKRIKEIIAILRDHVERGSR